MDKPVNADQQIILSHVQKVSNDHVTLYILLIHLLTCQFFLRVPPPENDLVLPRCQ